MGWSFLPVWRMTQCQPSLPTPLLFSPGNPSFHSSPLSGLTGLFSPCLDIFFLVFPFCSLVHIICLLYHKRSNFFHTQMRSCPFSAWCPSSWEAFPCLHLHLGGRGVLCWQSPCAHDPVPTSTTQCLWHYDIVTRHVLLICVLGLQLECDMLSVGAKSFSKFISLASITGRGMLGELKSLNGKCNV